MRIGQRSYWFMVEVRFLSCHLLLRDIDDAYTITKSAWTLEWLAWIEGSLLRHLMVYKMLRSIQSQVMGGKPNDWQPKVILTYNAIVIDIDLQEIEGTTQDRILFSFGNCGGPASLRPLKLGNTIPSRRRYESIASDFHTSMEKYEYPAEICK
ncbi:hypothetical protein L1987_56035 [Smallanthus sonchifolius]|uniref:Uncharacterized protein n=1 Tax=Smallanthus sonchifolius TaxID=185202 RepID=A0ACB9EBP0_9ASTR|nr:hypothetical protein L1987_56035 [Smallanthus sonchifolius]